MSANRDAKTAVVDEVRTRLQSATATVVTEYRGLTVAEMASLRRALRAVGGDYKVFKNTLVRRALEGSGHDSLAELLSGPTAIAFVSGDVSAVAKALRDFARTAPALVLKGGVFEGSLLGARELGALADLPSREVLLAQVAGAISAPLRTMASLLQALPQNLAFGLAALLESRGGERQGSAPEPDAADVADATGSAEPADEAAAEPAAEDAVTEAAVEPEATAGPEAAAEPEASEATEAAAAEADGGAAAEGSAEVEAGDAGQES